MKKISTIFLSIAMALSLTACGANSGNSSSSVQQSQSSNSANSTEQSAAGTYSNAPENSSETAQEISTENGSNILVAYFSWSGNGKQMAEWVADEVGGDLFRIVPEEAYSDDYNACADRAKNELDDEIRPALSSHIEADKMAGYDTVYLGFPIWWYDLPMPVWTFLEEYDFSGKTVIPFFSHNGSSGGANSLNRIGELIPNANYRKDDVLSLPGRSVADSESTVREWAKGF